MFGWFKKRPRTQLDFGAPLSPETDAFVGEATSEFNTKQEALHRDWRFGDEAEWGFDQETGRFTMTFPDGAGLEAKGQILGSYSTKDGSWEWAWNNPHVSDGVSRESKAVKKVGERFGIGYLQLGKFPLPGTEVVSFLCAIGLKATDSAGIYIGDAGPIDVMIMLKNLRRVGNWS